MRVKISDHSTRLAAAAAVAVAAETQSEFQLRCKARFELVQQQQLLWCKMFAAKPAITIASFDSCALHTGVFSSSACLFPLPFPTVSAAA